ncbi:unnamed protein product, partial [Polarella glacialis]
AVDDAQHTVFEAESVQLVGTADADALEAALRASGDGRWRPLRIRGAEQPPDSLDQVASQPGMRALMSIGIGDFRNTSVGRYQEMVLAFPACESAE